MANFALYIHIPFCKQICPYCDFNTYAVKKIPEAEYLAAMIKELDFHKQNSNFTGEISSIYFGGGTPSIFSSKSLGKFLDYVNKIYSVSHNAEISLEANPEDLNDSSCQEFKALNIQRISLGLQSLNDKYLKFLGRKHSASEAKDKIKKLLRYNDINLNLDLIYAVPNQTIQEIEEDLNQYIELSPQHISAYALTIEQGTPFFQASKQKLIKAIDEELAADGFELLISKLNDAGFQHYEISNFAKANFQSRHNLSYWNGDDYLGIGAGAHSFQRNPAAIRWMNLRSYADYIKEAGSQRTISWQENLAKDSEIFEFVYFSLRKIEGINLEKFKRTFNLDFNEYYKEILNLLFQANLIKITDNYMSLTNKGLLLADSVLAELAGKVQK